jgi:hypothetical protein
MIEFKNDEVGYFAWLAANPNGFVLNVRSEADPGYVVLHRSGCGSISSQKPAPGAYTCRSFRKWCAETVIDLRVPAKMEGRKDGSFSKRCGLCRP